MNVKINIKKLFGMTIRIKNLEQENSAFRKEAKLMQERIESYAQEVEHLRQRNHTWQKDFAASNSRCKALDEQCEMLKLEVENLKREDQAETINYLTDENDVLKRKNKYMNQVIGKLMAKIPKETLSPAEKRWCDLEEQLWKDREEFMKDEDPMDG